MGADYLRIKNQVAAIQTKCVEESKFHKATHVNLYWSTATATRMNPEKEHEHKRGQEQERQQEQQQQP